MNKIKLLIVDDEENFRKIMEEELKFLSYDITTASSSLQAKEKIEQENFDVILLDIKMPGMDGIEFLKKIKLENNLSEIIILTGYSTISSAVTAMRLGAYDYLTKPCDLEEINLVIKKAYEKKKLNYENILLKQELSRRNKIPSLESNNEKMKKIFEILDKVSPTYSSVLLTGESGTGKEVIATYIHQKSPRRDNSFIVVDCATLIENLLENELFGHEKGAFTDAISLKFGLFEVANKGTIFLDEITEMSLSTQAKLLRVLETNELRRLGGTKTIYTEVRVIAASNRNLEKLVKDGKFRDDLYFRLNVVRINLLPLRERKEDIENLTNYFINNANLLFNKNKKISKEALIYLKSYRFPGNIRELKNIIERAAILSEGEFIKIEDLLTFSDLNLEENIEEEVLKIPTLEKQHIKKVLTLTLGNRKKTAEILGISERTLYRKIKEFEIE